MYVSSTVGSVYVLHHPPLGRLDYVSKERFRFASAGRLDCVSTGRRVDDLSRLTSPANQARFLNVHCCLTSLDIRGAAHRGIWRARMLAHGGDGPACSLTWATGVPADRSTSSPVREDDQGNSSKSNGGTATGSGL